MGRPMIQRLYLKTSVWPQRRALLIFFTQKQGQSRGRPSGAFTRLFDRSEIAGYLDADLATSLQEAETIIERLIASDKKVAMGARVALADRDIRRGLMRHYLGRAFATFASSGLKATFYDTQCGAKFLGEATVCKPLYQNPLRHVGCLTWSFYGVCSMDPSTVRLTPVMILWKYRYNHGKIKQAPS